MRKPVAAVWDEESKSVIAICDDGSAFALGSASDNVDETNVFGYAWLQIPSIPGTETSDVPPHDSPNRG
jgi:hypothetical protein